MGCPVKFEFQIYTEYFFTTNMTYKYWGILITKVFVIYLKSKFVCTFCILVSAFRISFFISLQIVTAL